MNEDIVKGKWKQLKGEAQKKWGKLSDDQIEIINGDRHKLIGRIQENYGVTKDEASKQVEEWEKGYK